MFPIYMLLFALCISKGLSTPIDIRANTTEEYRLPQIYQLSNYKLDLKVPAESFTNRSNEYNGTVTIQFSFTNTSNYIALHAFYGTISVNNISFDGTAIDKARYAINNVTNILRINLTAAISGTSQHRLVIDFTGQLSTTVMSGFYKSSYVDKNGVTKYLATTQFEPTHARRAFPSFDEPGFKATFDVSISYPSTMKVLFNTPTIMISDNDTGTVTEIFDTTPKMSTYLLAFIISEFTCTSGDTVDTVSTQVCSRNESSTTRALAVEVGARILEKMNNFTNYNYNLSMSKMDQVAIPDFNAGAMENWGLVTYREAALLWDETESSNRYKQRVATVIAHEFAHQWFGDLVTCKWWSETFLNEGFARYFEYFITHEVFPTWELDKQFVVEQVHAVFGSDAADDVLALQSDCSTPSEISGKFGTISYSKGASVIRMLSHFLGVANFRTGLQKYLADNNHSSAEPEDLWAALNTTVAAANIRLPADIATVMNSWIKKGGFPLLTVKSNGNNVTVTQERFLVSGQDNTTQWYVPISHTTSRDSNKFENTAPSAWLSPDWRLTIALPANSTWIILNNQETGYYRVNYDDSLWASIGEALLKDNFDGITEINRAQIVDDLFNLARVSKVEYSSVFNVTTFLVNDTSYYPWYPAFSGYDFLLGKVGQSSKLGVAISSSVLALMKKLYDSVPFSRLDENNQIYTHKQVLALTWACRLGNEDCITETRNLYNTFKATNARPNKNLRTVVYCNALRYSNDSSDWEFLWNAYLNSTDLATEQVTILSTLGCSTNATLLQGYLQKIITDGSGIRLQDATSAFSAVYDRNPVGLEVAYDFVTENYQNISARFNNVNTPGTLLKGIAGQFTTEQQVNKLKTFAVTGNLPEALKTAANESIETAESNLKWLAQFKDDLEGYYGVPDSTSRTSASVLITVLAIIMCHFVIY